MDLKQSEYISSDNTNTLQDHILSCDRTLADLYGLSPEDFSDLRITDVGFSNRIINALMRYNVPTVASLLMISPLELSNIKNTGSKSVKEIINYVQGLTSIEKATIEDESEKEVPVVNIKEHIEAFINKYYFKVSSGNFESIDDSLLNSIELKIKNKLSNSYSILGSDLFFKAINRERFVSVVSFVFNSYYRENYFISAYKKAIENSMRKIPNHRLRYSVSNLINIYTDDGDLRKKLFSFYDDENSPLQSVICYCTKRDKKDFDSLLKFLNWCSFDIDEVIKSALEIIKTKKNLMTTITMRSQGHTLEETGQKLNVTRERVRQLEAKAIRIFSASQRQYNAIRLISADRNGDDVLTYSELQEYFGENTDFLVYIFASLNSFGYNYDKSLKIFTIGTEDVYNQSIAFIEENVPDVFDEKALTTILRIAKEEYGISEELLKGVIDDQYSHTGSSYHRSRLTKRTIYTEVISKHFPNGIRVYDKEEMSLFRKYTEEMFGDISLPQVDRSIAARIADISVLCDRGKYKLKQEKYLPDDLTNRIEKYIDNNDSVVFMFSTIFMEFEDELLSHGIDNRYYLQGVLRECFGSKYYFTRDYISKDSEFTSVSSEIIRFVKKYKTPVDKRVVYDNFPGVSEIVFAFSLGDPSIINLFGKYIHKDNVVLHDYDHNYLLETLEHFVSDGKTHHCKELFEYINKDQPSLLKRYYVLYNFGLFSLLECFFGEEYNFERPYISRSDVSIERGNEQLLDFIYKHDCLLISSITDMSRKLHISIYSILEYINNINDAYLMVNIDSIATYDYIGIDEIIAQKVEDLIVSDLGNQPVYVNELQSIHMLPKINVDWNEWLVYSVLKRWGTKTVVGTVLQQDNIFHQYRYSLPVVKSIECNVDFETMKKQQDSQQAIFKVDDLDNIDELLMDIYLEED